MIEGLSATLHSLKGRLAQGQERSYEPLQSDPSLDYPYTLSDSKGRIEHEEARLDAEKPKSIGKGKTRVSVDDCDDDGRKKGLTPQAKSKSEAQETINGTPKAATGPIQKLKR